MNCLMQSSLSAACPVPSRALAAVSLPADHTLTLCAGLFFLPKPVVVGSQSEWSGMMQ